jgi:hypothetical protein
VTSSSDRRRRTTNTMAAIMSGQKVELKKRLVYSFGLPFVLRVVGATVGDTRRSSLCWR